MPPLETRILQVRGYAKGRGLSQRYAVGMGWHALLDNSPAHTPPPHTCQNEFPSPRSPHGHVGAPPSSTLSTKTNLDEIWSSPDLLEQYEKARWADMIIFMSPPYSHPSLPNPNADRAQTSSHSHLINPNPNHTPDP